MTKINGLNQIKSVANKAVGKDIIMSTDECLKKTIAVIKDRISKEIPDTGYFRSFAEDFHNTDENIYARAISIAVERDTNSDGRAFLSVNLLHPTMFLNTSSELAYGDRKKLLEAIDNPDFIQKLKDKIAFLSEK